MNIQLIEDLLDVIDSVDRDTYASKIEKEMAVITYGFGMIGDKWPITTENVVAWYKLRDMYFNALKNGDYHTEALRIALSTSTFELLNRSFTSETAHYLFEKLPARWRFRNNARALPKSII